MKYLPMSVSERYMCSARLGYLSLLFRCIEEGILIAYEDYLNKGLLTADLLKKSALTFPGHCKIFIVQKLLELNGRFPGLKIYLKSTVPDGYEYVVIEMFNRERSIVSKSTLSKIDSRFVLPDNCKHRMENCKVNTKIEQGELPLNLSPIRENTENNQATTENHLSVLPIKPSVEVNGIIGYLPNLQNLMSIACVQLPDADYGMVWESIDLFRFADQAISDNYIENQASASSSDSSDSNRRLRLRDVPVDDPENGDNKSQNTEEGT